MKDNKLLILVIVFATIMAATTRRNQETKWFVNSCASSDCPPKTTTRYYNLIIEQMRHWLGLANIVPPLTVEFVDVVNDDPGIEILVNKICSGGFIIDQKDITFILKYSHPYNLRGILGYYYIRVDKNGWYAIHVDGSVAHYNN